MKLLFCALTALSLALISGCKPSGPAATAYPFDTCPISGQKLGAHGDPVVFVKDGQQVKLCCDACQEDFDKNAPALLSQIKSGKVPTPAK